MPLLLILSGCGGITHLAGGLAAPDVLANVQAGRTNAQTLGSTSISDQRLVEASARSIEQSAGRTGVRSEHVETLVVREDPPAWLLLVALLGWLLPTPTQIGRALRSLWD